MALMDWAAHMLQPGGQPRQRCETERTAKTPVSSDRALKLTLVKSESLVTVYEQGTVNLNRALYKLPVTRRETAN